MTHKDTKTNHFIILSSAVLKAPAMQGCKEGRIHSSATVVISLHWATWWATLWSQVSVLLCTIPSVRPPPKKNTTEGKVQDWPIISNSLRFERWFHYRFLLLSSSVGLLNSRGVLNWPGSTRRVCSKQQDLLVFSRVTLGLKMQPGYYFSFFISECTYIQFQKGRLVFQLK